MPGPQPVEPRVPAPGSERLDRRAAVRRSAAVLAGAAGLLAVPALTGSAAAEAGDTLRLGGRNDAGDAQTRLQAETTVATLSVLNERIRREDSVGEVDLVAPQLRLAGPIPGASRPQLPDVRTLAAGDLAAAGGLLYYGAEAGDFDVLPSQVFTSTFANYLHPVPAGRATVLDTRALSTERRQALGAGSFAAEGQLVGGRRIALDLRSLVNTSAVAPRAAVALSLQILAAQAGGVLRVHEDATGATGVDIVSYAVLPAEVTRTGRPYPLPASGAAIVGLDREDRLWLALSSTAHLVVRVTGVFVADPTVVVESPLPADASPYARRVQRQREAMRRLTAATRAPV